MKLHRIDTVNVNSLYGPCSLDLDAVLSGATLFLIHGPTGSGKSTLMDAVSLALFGITPRLDGQRDSKKGVVTRDPRAIMSRGTGQCAATVVFSKLEGGSRRAYRAEWSCRTARKKPGANLQLAHRALFRKDDDGEWQMLVSSAKKADYNPIFEQVLEGFGVNDFNRSMLLAQGQFDAFLGAQPTQRAEILERLTDTSLYQELGQRAARLHVRHKRRIEALRTLAAAGGGLDAAGLAAVQHLHEQNEQALSRQTVVFERAHDRLAWFREQLELGLRLGRAAEQRQQAQHALEQAAGDLERLQIHETCEAQRAFVKVDGHRTAVSRQVLIREAITKVEAEIVLCRAEVDKTRRVVAAATTIEEASSRHLDGLRPLARAAEHAAMVSAEADRSLAAVASQVLDLDRLVASSASAVDVAKRASQRAQTARVVAHEELLKHAIDAELDAAWDPIRTRLDQLEAELRRLSKSSSELEDRREQLRQAEGSVNLDRAVFDASRSADLGPAQARVATARGALESTLAGNSMHDRRSVLAEAVHEARLHLGRVQAAIQPVRIAHEGRSKLRDLAEQTALAAGVLAGARRDQQRLVALAQQAEVAVQALEAAGERTRRIAALVQHRSVLVDGEACPLCGAEQHPWAHDDGRVEADARVNETLQEHEHAVRQAVDQRELAERGVADAALRCTNSEAKLELLAEQRAVLEASQAQAEAELSAVMQELGAPLLGSPAYIDGQLDSARSRALRAEQALEDLDAHRRAVDDAVAALHQVVERHAREEADLGGRTASLIERAARIAADAAAHQQAVRGAGEEREACRGLLRRYRLLVPDNDVSRWRALGDERRRRHQVRVTRVTAADAAVQKSGAVLEAEASKLAEFHRQLRAAKVIQLELEPNQQALAAALRQATEAMETAWQHAVVDRPEREVGVGTGLAPMDLVRRQQAWWQHKRDELILATEAHQVATAALADASTRHKTHGAQLEAQERVVEGALASLQAVLQALQLTIEQLDQARLDDGMLAVLRARRKELQERQVQAQAVWVERQQQLDAHRQQRPDDLPDDIVEDALIGEEKAAAEGLATTTEAHRETGDALRDHERAVKEQGDARRRLHQAEDQARVWKTLHETIGVGDGGRFKEFAQALNLGQLLDRANVHLARLSKRYRLIPRLEGGLPTLEFDLEDLWQAGQRASPRSLSGGERFLVSLSLALGLSDFRAVKMPIETLLLDEGFGTLDQDSLNVALSALSQLQADGRQVGIISHVVGLHERIAACIEVRPLGGGRSEVVA